MTGVFVNDALATNLLAGVALDADGNDEGTALRVNSPGYVSFHLSLPDPNAADDATIQVQIEGCETSDFSTSPVVPIVAFPTILEAAHNTAIAAGQTSYRLETYVDFTFIRSRSIVIDGTNGDWNVGDAATLYMRLPGDGRGHAINCVADTDTWFLAAGPFNPAA